MHLSCLIIINALCRFYKNPDKLRTVLHVGTVIEGPSEYKSSRMTNKERKQTIADALTLHEPMIRSNIIRILGEQDFNALRTPEGRIALQDELTAALAQIIKRETGQSDGVEAVLFTDFVMQ